MGVKFRKSSKSQIPQLKTRKIWYWKMTSSTKIYYHKVITSKSHFRSDKRWALRNQYLNKTKSMYKSKNKMIPVIFLPPLTLIKSYFLRRMIKSHTLHQILQIHLESVRRRWNSRFVWWNSSNKSTISAKKMKNM